MDVASRPLYQHDRETRTSGAPTRAVIAATLLILAGLCLLAVVAGMTAGLLPEPASERVLLAPLRWS